MSSLQPLTASSANGLSPPPASDSEALLQRQLRAASLSSVGLEDADDDDYHINGGSPMVHHQHHHPSHRLIDSNSPDSGHNIRSPTLSPPPLLSPEDEELLYDTNTNGNVDGAAGKSLFTNGRQPSVASLQVALPPASTATSSVSSPIDPVRLPTGKRYFSNGSAANDTRQGSNSRPSSKSSSRHRTPSKTKRTESHTLNDDALRQLPTASPKMQIPPSYPIAHPVTPTSPNVHRGATSPDAVSVASSRDSKGTVGSAHLAIAPPPDPTRQRRFGASVDLGNLRLRQQSASNLSTDTTASLPSQSQIESNSAKVNSASGLPKHRKSYSTHPVLDSSALQQLSALAADNAARSDSQSASKPATTVNTDADQLDVVQLPSTLTSPAITIHHQHSNVTSPRSQPVTQPPTQLLTVESDSPIRSPVRIRAGSMQLPPSLHMTPSATIAHIHTLHHQQHDQQPEANTVTTDTQGTQTSQPSSVHSTPSKRFHQRSQSVHDVSTSAMTMRHAIGLTVEQRKLRRRLLEAGVLRFNTNALQGLQFLSKQGLVDLNDPESVADFLVTTGGLSKSAIGDYLGDADPFHVAVMYAYVNKLDFTGMTFVKALRFFLSGFRLPGEAQMIDRMMEKFSERFCRSNPEQFTDQDSAYLLAYSLIMLNTDAHSDKVKHKMTRNAFLRNCRDLLRQGVTKEYLLQCFDDVVKNEVKTNSGYLEQLYSRVQISDITAIKLMRRRRGLSQTRLRELRKSEINGQHANGNGESQPATPQLTNGSPMNGFGSLENVYEPLVFSDDELPTNGHSEDDCDPHHNDLPTPPHGSQVELHHSTPGTIAVRGQTQNGHGDATSSRYSRRDLARDSLSIPGDDSFFDLRRVAHLSRLTAGTVFMKYGKHGKPHMRRVWLTEDTNYLCYSDPSVHDRNANSSSVKRIAAPDIIDVTIGRDSTAVLNKHHIPTYKDHLCFSVIAKNRTLDLEGDAVKEVHLWVSYLTMQAERNRFSLRAATVQAYRLQKEEKMIVAIQLWKTLVLPNWNTTHQRTQQRIRDIWRIGIPPSIRCKVWPMAIGNSLEITPDLFQSFLRLARLNHSLRAKGERAFVGHEDSVTALEKDLTITFPELRFFHSRGQNLPGDAMREVLQAYMLFRPDVGYMTGMSHLTAMLLLYTEVYDTFVCLVNLLHSHFFLAYCRMEIHQLEWRFSYFDHLIHTHMPDLFHHLQQIDLPCSEYVVDWCRSLFTRALPLDVAGKVWDWYLLDGEIIVFRIALGLLHYYRRQLVRSTYDECIFLLCHIDQELNEVDFWQSVSVMSANDIIEPKAFKAMLAQHNNGYRKYEHSFGVDTT